MGRHDQGAQLPLRLPRPTLKTIAVLAGCSRQTVSLALRNDGQIPATTRKRIQKIAREVGYAPDARLGALMAHVRSREPAKFRATIAMLHAVPRARAEAVRWYQEWRSGGTARAQKAGYGIDDFWLVDEPQTPATLQRILHARGILGLLIPCLANELPLAPALHPLLARYPCAIVGYPDPLLPAFSVATNDHYACGAALFARALAAGCRRIGAVVSSASEPLSDPRFSSAILAGSRGRRDLVALPTLMCPSDCHRDFARWMQRHRPDCVITSVPAVWDWLALLGVPVPAKVSFLFWRLHGPDGEWSGSRQNDHEIGAAAVDVLTGHISRGEHGLPPVQVRVMIESSSIEGRTMRPPRPVRRAQ